MKLFVILCSLVVISAKICSAIPAEDKVDVKSSYNEISGGSYKFGYDLTDGQSRAEEGKLVQVGDKQVLRVTGSYSYVGDNGLTYNVNYAADEKGYQPVIEVVKKTKVEKMLKVLFNQMTIIAKKKNDNLGKSLLG